MEGVAIGRAGAPKPSNLGLGCIGNKSIDGGTGYLGVLPTKETGSIRRKYK